MALKTPINPIVAILFLLTYAGGVGFHLGRVVESDAMSVRVYEQAGGSQAACTRDVQVCSDGSQLSRTGPHCEFESCVPDASCPEEVCPLTASEVSKTNLTADINLPRDLWAQNVGDSVVLWWADAPEDTDRLILYRAISAEGSWEKAVEVKLYPDMPSSVLDNTDGTLDDLYYRMEALDVSGEIVKNFEVVWVPKVAPDSVI
jgi:hypothetical protein